MDANQRNNAGFDPKKTTECLTEKKNRQLLAAKAMSTNEGASKSLQVPDSPKVQPAQ